MATVLEQSLARAQAPKGARAHRSRPSRRQFLRWFAILAVVWSLSGSYEGKHLKRGWVPWDAGAYAQSAQRVLYGQLPHRDFVEVYTGGLTYLDAAAMRIFGNNLAAERFMLFAFFMMWIPALYWIASQYCRDWMAGALVLLAVAWSVPNYSEAVPSWYNLFFATFGIAALLAYMNRPAWRWLFVAGACGGFAFLAKSTGLCYVAGVLLFFLFHEQSTNQDSSPPRGKWRAPVYTAFLFVCLSLFLALLVRLISPLLAASGGEFVLFVLPSAVLCGVLFSNELRNRGSPGSIPRFANLFRICVPFGIGMVLPVAAFLIPYLRAHALGILLHDLFAQASQRIAMANDLPDAMVTIVPTIFLAAMLALSARVSKFWRGILVACVGGLLAAGLLRARSDYDSYIAVWSAAYWVIPVLSVMGGVLLATSSIRPANPEARQRVFLVLSITALCSLVEFPFSSPIYFCYVAPLAILALTAILQSLPRVSRAMLAVLYTGFLTFAVFVVTPGFIYVIGYRYAPDVQHTVMNVRSAGGLRVSAQSVAVYDELIPLIREHAGSGEIYAAPDCPEVYFLSGYRNFTPDIYDFLDPRAHQPQRVLNLLARSGVRVVVLNLNPPLSPVFSKELHEAIAQRFGASQMVGNFEVRWRE